MRKRLGSVRLYAGVVGVVATILACSAKDNSTGDAQAKSPVPNNSSTASSNGGTQCPTIAEVSTIMGFDVRQVAGGRYGDEFDCGYADAKVKGGTTVVAKIAPLNQADEVLGQMDSNAKTMGGPSAAAVKIPVGERGMAYGTVYKSEAATTASGHFYLVEITVLSGEGHGDKKDAAVALLKRMME